MFKYKKIFTLIITLELIIPNLVKVNAVQVFKTGGINSQVVFGVISDTHITATKTAEKERLTKIFKFTSSKELDAIVVVGDLTDTGSKSEYDTWKSIKDDNKGKVKLIASMGNHDGDTADLFTSTTGNVPNSNYVINGYHFITLSPGYGIFNTNTGRATSQGKDDYSYVVAWLKTQLDIANKENANKPIFVFFHHPLKNTVYVSDEWYGTGLANGKGDTFQSVFSKYPQVVTFSGHIHSPNNNPESIWQDGGFTSVNTATTSYFEMEKGMVYGTEMPYANEAAQEMIVQVKDSKVTINNYDILSNQFIPQTWAFDVSKPTEFPYTKAREAIAKSPVFTKDAKIRISNITENGTLINFDQAVMEYNSIGDIVHSYRYDFINKITGNVDKSFKTWSGYYIIPTPNTITQQVVGLNSSTEYEVRIYAIDAFRKISNNYIAKSFKTMDITNNPSS